MPLWLKLSLFLLGVFAFVCALVFAIGKLSLPKKPVLSKLSAPCPVCAGKEIYQTGNTLECASCHSVLKVTINSRVLLVIPLLVGFAAAMFFVQFLERSGILAGVLLAGVRGALVASGFGFAIQTCARALSYRVVKP
jgi:hypothetical protein